MGLFETVEVKDTSRFEPRDSEFDRAHTYAIEQQPERSKFSVIIKQLHRRHFDLNNGR